MTLFWEWSWSFLPLCFVPCLPWWMGEGVFWRSKHRLFSLFWFYGGSDFWRNVCHGWVGGGGGLWHSNHRLTTACLTAELLLTCLALMASPDHQIIIAVITTTITICLIAADTPCSPDLSWSSDQSSVEVITDQQVWKGFDFSRSNLAATVKLMKFRLERGLEASLCNWCKHCKIGPFEEISLNIKEEVTLLNPCTDIETKIWSYSKYLQLHSLWSRLTPR